MYAGLLQNLAIFFVIIYAIAYYKQMLNWLSNACWLLMWSKETRSYGIICGHAHVGYGVKQTVNF